MWITLLLLLGVLVLVTVRPAAAHAVPVLSQPQPNELLPQPLDRLTIQFNEPVVPNLSRITLLTQAGEQVAGGEVVATDQDNRTLGVTLPPLRDGTYLVSWQVLSAVDGHTTTGTFSFGVGVTELAAVSGDSEFTAQFSALSAIARWLALTGLVVLVGFFSFRLLILNPVLNEVELDRAERALDLTFAHSSRRIALVGMLGLAASILFILIDQSLTYELLNPTKLRVWLGTQFGLMWATRLILLGLLAPLVVRQLTVTDRSNLHGRFWWLGLTLTLLLTLANAFTSHSAALAQAAVVAPLIDFTHTFAAAMWGGSLLFLALLAWQARRLDQESRLWLNLTLVLNFSAVAALAVGALLVSGGYLAWQHVGGWTALVGTAYGLALLVKLGLALPALFVGGLNLMVVKPRLRAAYDRDDFPAGINVLRPYRRLVLIEAALALLVLAAAGLLTDLQRGVDAPLIADAPGETELTYEADDLNVKLSITPALVGSNEFEIDLTDSLGKPIDNASEVSLRFTFLGQSLGAAEGTAVPAGNGRYTLNGSYISLIGSWQTEVVIRRQDTFDTFAPFRLDAGLGGTIRSQESGGRPLERFARFMQLAGGGATGTFLVLFALGWGLIGVRAMRREWQLLPLLFISLLTLWLGANQLINFFTIEYTPSKFTTNPILPDVESIAVGQDLFQRNCAACHGDRGLGDGPTAATLPSPPANFTTGHTATHSDGDLYYWIREGIEETPMPAFADQLSKDETWHLVNYVRRLGSEALEP